MLFLAEGNLGVLMLAEGNLRRCCWLRETGGADVG